MLKWYKLKVDSLHEWPNHPILLQSVLVTLVKLVLWTAALHDSHTAEEHEQVGRSKDGLIDGNTSSNLEVLVLQHDLVLEEFEPGGGSWTEDGFGGVS